MSSEITHRGSAAEILVLGSKVFLIFLDIRKESGSRIFVRAVITGSVEYSILR